MENYLWLFPKQNRTADQESILKNPRTFHSTGEEENVKNRSQEKMMSKHKIIYFMWINFFFSKWVKFEVIWSNIISKSNELAGTFSWRCSWGMWWLSSCHLCILFKIRERSGGDFFHKSIGRAWWRLALHLKSDWKRGLGSLVWAIRLLISFLILDRKFDYYLRITQLSTEGNLLDIWNLKLHQVL